MIPWSDERQMPAELLRLLNAHDIPSELKRELLKASEEIDNNGAVTYPTKARIEYYMERHHVYLQNFFESELSQS